MRAFAKLNSFDPMNPSPSPPSDRFPISPTKSLSSPMAPAATSGPSPTPKLPSSTISGCGRSLSRIPDSGTSGTSPKIPSHGSTAPCTWI